MDYTGDEQMSAEEWAALAASRSRVYGFLGALYNRLPDDQFAESLTGPDLPGFLLSLAGMDDLPEDMREGAKLIERFIQASEGKPVDELRTELAVERTRLLRGVKPGYSPPPPYESVYLGLDQQPLMQSTISVTRAYTEAKAILPEEVHDQPDFIGFELDFMRHLCLKESEAWKSDDQDQALKYLGKERGFLEEHITRWVPRFCDVMFKEARLDLYRGIARMTKGFVLDETRKSAEYLEWAGTAKQHNRR